jgi:hypothetical protein
MRLARKCEFSFPGGSIKGERGGPFSGTSPGSGAAAGGSSSSGACSKAMSATLRSTSSKYGCWVWKYLSFSAVLGPAPVERLPNRDSESSRKSCWGEGSREAAEA